MIKFKILILIIINLFFITTSCKKKAKELILPPLTVYNSSTYCNNCPSAYDLHSHFYSFIYKGKLSRGCLNGEQYVHTDKYEYLHLCINPNNPYEIAFVRRENKGFPITTGELYTYNFCNNIIKLLATNAFYDLDWSVKNWIVFTGKDYQLWKIKSNGDSLIQLTNSGTNNAAKWSPDGTIYIWNGNKIANEKGIVLQTLPVSAETYAWKNNEIVYIVPPTGPKDPLSLYELILNTNTANKIMTIPKNGIGNIWGKGKNKIYIIVSNQGVYNTYQYNTLSNDTLLLFTYGMSNFLAPFYELPDNRIIIQQKLQDTFTNGNICKLNYRSHIAICNIDGTNERQVLPPE
jgi:hypothetical protein